MIPDKTKNGQIGASPLNSTIHAETQKPKATVPPPEKMTSNKSQLIQERYIHREDKLPTYMGLINVLENYGEEVSSSPSIFIISDVSKYMYLNFDVIDFRDQNCLLVS